MADKPKTDRAKQRASFARAKRLHQEREASGSKAASAAKATEEKRDRARSAGRSPSPRDQDEQRRKQTTPDPARTSWDRKPTPPEQAQGKAFAAWQASQRRRELHRKEQTRTDFNRAADRRRNQDQRQDRDKRQQAAKAAIKRANELRQTQQKQKEQSRREQLRKAFNRRAADAKQQAQKEAEQKRQAMLKDLAAKAKAAVEQDQKRREADKLAQQRRETADLRNQHRRDRDSFRTNEGIALERHHGAMKRLDAAEQRAIDDYDGRRAGLVGKIKGLAPGSGRRADAERQKIRDGFEAERMQKHRDLEAFKERQFKAEQAMRIGQAKERLQLMTGHRGDHEQFKHQQAADKPRQIEQRQVAMAAAQQREQDRAREQAKDRTAGGAKNLTAEFNRERVAS